MLVAQPIAPGATPLASTLVVEQTGPLQLTVRAGAWTTTGDVAAGVPSQTYALAGDEVLTIQPDATLDKWYRVDLVANGASVDVLLRSAFTVECSWPAVPAGWQVVQTLAPAFLVRAGTTDLGGVPIAWIQVVS